MMTRRRGFEKLREYENDETVKLPVRSTKGSAAYDLYAKESATIKSGEKHKFKLGVKAYMQEDEALFIITRSGNGTKRRVTLANNIGLIDSDYYDNEDNEGELIVMLANDGTDDFEVKPGDRIAQAFFQKILLADDDSVLAKMRKGGFGSTGSN